jgi:hypothetical protein
MVLYSENLDELEYDLERHQLHISPFLSGQGQHNYVHLIRDAIQNADDHIARHKSRGNKVVVYPGTVNKNTEPFPSPSDSTQILPPWVSIIRLTMAKPTPVPSTLGSSLSNKPKMRS